MNRLVCAVCRRRQPATRTGRAVDMPIIAVNVRGCWDTDVPAGRLNRAIAPALLGLFDRAHSSGQLF
jgi:hypothetical protein